MRTLVLVLVPLLLAPVAIAHHQSESLASITWTGTVFAPDGLLPAYPHQCFDIAVDAGAGATLARANLQFGDGDAGVGRPLALELDEDGRAQTSVCHAYRPRLIVWDTALAVATTDGRFDLDCIDMHWLTGPRSDEDPCEDF